MLPHPSPQRGWVSLGLVIDVWDMLANKPLWAQERGRDLRAAPSSGGLPGLGPGVLHYGRSECARLWPCGVKRGLEIARKR